MKIEEKSVWKDPVFVMSNTIPSNAPSLSYYTAVCGSRVDIANISRAKLHWYLSDKVNFFWLRSCSDHSFSICIVNFWLARTLQVISNSWNVADGVTFNAWASLNSVPIKLNSDNLWDAYKRCGIYESETLSRAAPLFWLKFFQRCRTIIVWVFASCKILSSKN